MLSEKADGKMAKAGLIPVPVFVSIIENGYWVAQRKGVYMGRTEKRIKVKLLWEDKIKYFSPNNVRFPNA